MSSQSILQIKPSTSAPLLGHKGLEALVNIDPKANRRARIWDISPALHCSIIGTCLTAAELRQFFVRFGDTDAKTITDHAIHSRGVRAAGQHDVAGKMLHKLLDNRHETTVKRFSNARTTAEVRELWLKAFDEGVIPSAYWAVLTHPATDRPLIEEAFGQVHMLSHMVGSSNRMDIARLRDLEREIGERDAKLARQEARLAAGASDRSELLRRIETLEAENRRLVFTEQMIATSSGGPDAAALLLRIDTEKAHATRLAGRVGELEEQLQAARKFAANLHKQNNQLESELAAVEATLQVDVRNEDEVSSIADELNGLTLLYVGGRPGLIEQLKVQCAKRGATLLAHDGGIEENSAALPGLISRADVAFFPVDCVSHHAAGQVKKLCRDHGKPFVPLRAASVASFISAVGDRSRFSLIK
ncbi:DUF2325 domain-containing protein [Tardiphaga robiniae]|uniref:DUF2325 domain-containing protein n=1 Tax=Tardiphaga robiniae TaxID=943830 RepID=A0A164AHN4_9BRAD|nr:DUF2325 domain-containing protein [Tardiphaga robiniae]KZD24825.1 hypothetical protein A4A58_21035 [Tardiphaga robiniae]